MKRDTREGKERFVYSLYRQDGSIYQARQGILVLCFSCADLPCIISRIRQIALLKQQLYTVSLLAVLTESLKTMNIVH